MSDVQKKWLADPTIPEPIRRALLSGARLERIALDSEGHFWHEGERITDPRISELFHRSIQRTPGGSYLLVVAPFSYPLEVHDVPYWVTQLALEPSQDGGPPRLRVRLSDGSEEELAVDTLRYQPRRGVTCRVKGGTLPARFSRPCYFALAEHITEEDEADAATPASVDGAAQTQEPVPGRLSLVLGTARYPIPVDAGEPVSASP
jgi:hypothetical protein